jgi:hypothetical protein
MIRTAYDLTEPSRSRCGSEHGYHFAELTASSANPELKRLKVSNRDFADDLTRVADLRHGIQVLADTGW